MGFHANRLPKLCRRIRSARVPPDAAARWFAARAAAANGWRREEAEDAVADRSDPSRAVASRTDAGADAEPAAPLPPITAMDRLARARSATASPRAGLIGAWVLTVVVLVGAVAATIVWRDAVVRVWPPSSRILGADPDRHCRRSLRQVADGKDSGMNRHVTRIMRRADSRHVLRQSRRKIATLIPRNVAANRMQTVEADALKHAFVAGIDDREKVKQRGA